MAASSISIFFENALVRWGIATSQVRRLQPGLLRYPREHLGAEFVGILEGPRVFTGVLVSQSNMRAALRIVRVFLPPDLKKRRALMALILSDSVFHNWEIWRPAL